MAIKQETFGNSSTRCLIASISSYELYGKDITILKKSGAEITLGFGVSVLAKAAYKKLDSYFKVDEQLDKPCSLCALKDLPHAGFDQTNRTTTYCDQCFDNYDEFKAKEEV
jgi:hypothetical protein